MIAEPRASEWQMLRTFPCVRDELGLSSIIAEMTQVSLRRHRPQPLLRVAAPPREHLSLRRLLLPFPPPTERCSLRESPSAPWPRWRRFVNHHVLSCC